MKSIVCIGELLIDFICTDINQDLVYGENYIKKAGGAPANVTAVISKLGGNSYFAGKVGLDAFGRFLEKTLKNAGVDTSMLVFDKEKNTTLAFVSLKDNGERDFIFNRGADENFQYDDLDDKKINDASIVHFGSATALLGGELMDTYMQAMNYCSEVGKFISFDPNYRLDLWKGREQEFIKRVKECLKLSDFIKVSDEELFIITGEKDIEKGVDILHQMGVQSAAVTLGKEGTYVSNTIDKGIVGSIKIKSIDSTGAGDAFVGAFLYKLSLMDNPKDVLQDFICLKDIVFFANKVGAVTCTKMGAISVLPTLEEVNNYD